MMQQWIISMLNKSLNSVIGIAGLYDEISNFHSRVMGLYSSNCR
jgi:hypothetical protein